MIGGPVLRFEKFLWPPHLTHRTFFFFFCHTVGYFWNGRPKTSVFASCKTLTVASVQSKFCFGGGSFSVQKNYQILLHSFQFEWELFKGPHFYIRGPHPGTPPQGCETLMYKPCCTGVCQLIQTTWFCLDTVSPQSLTILSILILYELSISILAAGSIALPIPSSILPWNVQQLDDLVSGHYSEGLLLWQTRKDPVRKTMFVFPSDPVKAGTQWYSMVDISQHGEINYDGWLDRWRSA